MYFDVEEKLAFFFFYFFLTPRDLFRFRYDKKFLVKIERGNMLFQVKEVVEFFKDGGG